MIANEQSNQADLTKGLEHYIGGTARRFLTNQVISPVFFVAGSLVIVLALISFTTELAISDLMHWLKKIFSSAFLLLYFLFVSLGTYATYRLYQIVETSRENASDALATQGSYWCEIGQQVGNALATLALTFTLLGISLGIGTLAEQPLTQENIQLLINGLTKQFSMAFMTTVIGLPTAALFRALTAVLHKRSLLITIKDSI